MTLFEATHGAGRTAADHAHRVFPNLTRTIKVDGEVAYIAIEADPKNNDSTLEFTALARSLGEVSGQDVDIILTDTEHLKPREVDPWVLDVKVKAESGRFQEIVELVPRTE